MSVLTWLALAGAFALLPSAVSSLPRVRALAVRGRLAGGASAIVPRHRARPASWPAPTRALMAACAAAIALAVCSVAGIALGVASGAAALVVVRLARVAQRRRRRQRRYTELLAGLRVLMAELESGGRPAEALRAAGASAPRYRATFDHAAQASTSGQVAATLLDPAQPELHPLAHGWAVAEHCGVPLAATVSRVIDDLADRIGQQRVVAVALAGPRSSMALLALLPLLGIGLGTAMGAQPVPFLLATSTGHGVCAAGVLLETAGLLWTSRLLARAERA